MSVWVSGELPGACAGTCLWTSRADIVDCPRSGRIETQKSRGAGDWRVTRLSSTSRVERVEAIVLVETRENRIRLKLTA